MRIRRPNKKPNETLEDRFWRDVEKGNPEECWSWVGATDARGYGVMAKCIGNHKSIQMKASRFSWELHNSRKVGSLFVCHRCDNPICVNPNHLFLGTPKQNYEDSVTKGRNTRGTRVHCSKLTDQAVRVARRLHLFHGFKISDLMKLFGLTKTPMWQAVTGRKWKHVPMP